jgi:hypothetical protein
LLSFTPGLDLELLSLMHQKTKPSLGISLCEKSEAEIMGDLIPDPTLPAVEEIPVPPT